MYAAIFFFYCRSLDVPGAPTDLTASDIDATSLNLSWHAPKNNGGAEISGYYVERRTGFNPRWVAVNRNPVHIPALSIDDLTEGREYEFRVIAENEVGVSKPSETAGPFKAQEPYGKLCKCCNLETFNRCK